MKSLPQWIKNPDVEISATGWPAVAVVGCIFAALVWATIPLIRAIL